MIPLLLKLEVWGYLCSVVPPTTGGDIFSLHGMLWGHSNASKTLFSILCMVSVNLAIDTSFASKSATSSSFSLLHSLDISCLSWLLTPFASSSFFFFFRLITAGPAVTGSSSVPAWHPSSSVERLAAELQAPHHAMVGSAKLREGAPKGKLVNCSSSRCSWPTLAKPSFLYISLCDVHAGDCPLRPVPSPSW